MVIINVIKFIIFMYIQFYSNDLVRVFFVVCSVEDIEVLIRGCIGDVFSWRDYKGYIVRVFVFMFRDDGKEEGERERCQCIVCRIFEREWFVVEGLIIRVFFGVGQSCEIIYVIS